MHCLLPLWTAIRRKCSHLFGSVIFAWSLLEGVIAPLLHSHTHTHTKAFTLFPFFFALSPLSLPLLSYSASPRCVCQWLSVVLCAGPTSGTAASHKSASSFNRYRQGLSLCPWICATLQYLYFSLYSPSLSPRPPSVSPLFSLSPLTLTLLFPPHPLSSWYFDTQASRNLLVTFWCSPVGKQHGRITTLPSLYCLQLKLCNITDFFTFIAYPTWKFLCGAWGLEMFWSVFDAVM